MNMVLKLCHFMVDAESDVKSCTYSSTLEKTLISLLVSDISWYVTSVNQFKSRPASNECVYLRNKATVFRSVRGLFRPNEHLPLMNEFLYVPIQASPDRDHIDGFVVDRWLHECHQIQVARERG